MNARTCLSIAFAVSVAAPVGAQSALARHDVDAPITFDADKLDVRDNAAQALLTGSVRIVQGTMTLTADQVKLFYTRTGGKDPQVDRLDAQDHVVLTSPSERATGRYGIYDVTQRVVTMSGDVVLTRGESVLRGQRLTIDLDSGRSTLDAGVVGGAKSGTAGGGGRVSGRFVVPPRNPK